MAEKGVGITRRLAPRAPSLAVIDHDHRLRITRWNRGAERIFGYREEEVIDRPLPEIIFAGKGSDAWQRRALEASGAPSIWAGVHKDGHTLSCEWIHEPICDSAGTPVGTACFGRDVTAESQRARKEQVLRVMTDHLPLSAWASDPDGAITLVEGKDPTANHELSRELLGTTVFDLHPEMAPQIRKALAGERAYWSVEVHGAHNESWAVPVRDEGGELTAVIGVTLDISKSKRIEQYLRTQLDLVKRQQRALRDMSTSIIEVWDDVLALPLVGLLDSTRPDEVTSALLDAISRTGARFTILDLTGVDEIDTATASYLVDLARAVRLLGAEAIVTGIRASVARTVVSGEIDLRGVRTLANLREALRHCIRQQKER